MSDSAKSIKQSNNNLNSLKRTAKPFVAITNFHNLKREQIFYYIVSLHKRIRQLLKKCRKYREKITKLKQKQKTDYDNEKEDIEVNEDDNAENDTDDHKVATASFIDDIKEAAANAQNSMGFVYEPTSGLYYDSKTGYYYNAEHGLYYDGNSGCYYSYNQETNKFEFHSQVYAEEPPTKEITKQTNQTDEDKPLKRQGHKRTRSSDDERQSTHKERKKHKKSRSRKHRRRESISPERKKYRHKKRSCKARKRSIERSRSIDADDSREDGEISDYEEEKSDTSWSTDESIVEILDSSRSNSPHVFDDTMEDVAKKYPPSIRMIVQDTNLKKLKIGELFIITYKGGSLGREGNHDVIIPDINCSKYHLKFYFDEPTFEYKCIDLGSRNGTLMDEKRMSNTKQESDPMAIRHGTTLQIGQTKLLCHIHDGLSTCDQCEPGLFQQMKGTDEGSKSVELTTVTTESVSISHKRQLKNLKKLYGLQDEKYAEPRSVKNDRAASRRKNIGSSCEHEKTKAASLHTSISSENKGFKMLSKLGWSEGQTLGKNQEGISEPIPLQSNQGTKGLGCSQPMPVNSKQDSRKSLIWRKTQERYQTSEQINIFDENSDEDDSNK